MRTRKHTHEEVFDTAPEELFEALHTPSAICRWWSAARAIVMPEQGGLWVAAWGENEDDPDYVTAARMRTFDPPRRIVMDDYRYRMKEGGLPFDAEFVIRFDVEPHEDGALLRVTQDGFPLGPVADDFYAACEMGWRDTFAGIRRYVEAHSAPE